MISPVLRARFGRWLDEALVQALAQWTRFL
jgi:hypothetical protein